MARKSITLLPVTVESYSGYRADEKPVAFSVNNMRFEITEVIDRWHEAYRDPGIPPSDYFKVVTRDKKQYILKHEHQPDRWYLWIKGESLNLFI